MAVRRAKASSQAQSTARCRGRHAASRHPAVRRLAERVGRGVGGFVVYGKDVESSEQLLAPA
jgi:hypothetical protein